MLVHISLRSGTLDVETASESTRTLRSMMKVLFLSYLLAHRIKRLQGTSRKLMNPSSTFTTFMSHTLRHPFKHLRNGVRESCRAPNQESARDNDLAY